nr:unnamed protein product [Callosobruchus analis]
MKQNQIRAARSLKPGCTSERCMRSKKRMCAKFTEDDRLSIFSMFSSDLNWDQRKMYVVAHVTRVNTKRKTASDESRRAETLIYTLTLNNIKYPVCKIMFLNTLALGSFTVQSWTRKGKHGRKPNEPTVTDIRALSYNVEGYIDYKLNFDEDWKQLPSRHKASNEVPIYPPLNKSKLPIKKSKFDHLQALKTVLPEDCQNFYDFLTYKND